jgi:hypothetical protein
LDFGGRDRHGDTGRSSEAAALANPRKREGENGEGDSESGLYRGSWKKIFVFPLKFTDGKQYKASVEVALKFVFRHGEVFP